MAEYIHVTTIGRTETEVKKEIQDIFAREVNHAAIFKRHTDAWEEHWETFGISVTGNLKLNQIVHASIFYLISNLPSEKSNQKNDPFYGLSPSGIGKGGILFAEYQGHSFWDTEMWMHPPMLLLNPQWSKDILSYRYNVRKAAEDNAKNTGYKGYRYPWESAFTGREVTPDCCPEVIEYQHHVIADIAFAYKSHLAATHDVDWFRNFGCDIAWNTAKFWESRVKFNETTDFYDIRGGFEF
jgi:trehalose/maltose hydrolase-like predicted phosphorylase